MFAISHAAKNASVEKLARHLEVNVLEPGWKLGLVDSGACTSTAPHGEFLTPFNTDAEKLHLVSAQGVALEHYGSQTVLLFFGGYHEKAAVTFQITNVRRVIFAVSKLTLAGYFVFFEPWNPRIENPRNGHVIKMRLIKGLFFVAYRA